MAGDHDVCSLPAGKTGRQGVNPTRRVGSHHSFAVCDAAEMAITALPLIDARGTPRQLGRAIGEGAREQVRRAVGHFQETFEWWAGMTFDEARRRALALAPHARGALRGPLEELAGTAEGAGVAVEDLLVLNCGEELTCSVAPVAERCTSLAMSRPGRTVVAHNEDWSESDIENLVLVRLTSSDGSSVLSATAAGYLPVTGMNSHGIATGADTVYGTDERAGIPNSLISRWALDAPTPQEQRRRSAVDGRSRGANRLCGQAGGTIWNVETSATRVAVRKAGQGEWLAHTNHYLEPELADIEGSSSPGSRHRLRRAQQLIAEAWEQGHEPADIAARVLRDHEGAPRSVCAHPIEDDASHGPTVASMIWELEERLMHVCAGRPCEQPYSSVRL